MSFQVVLCLTYTFALVYVFEKGNAVLSNLILQCCPLSKEYLWGVPQSSLEIFSSALSNIFALISKGHFHFNRPTSFDVKMFLVQMLWHVSGVLNPFWWLCMCWWKNFETFESDAKRIFSKQVQYNSRYVITYSGSWSAWWFINITCLSDISREGFPLALYNFTV